MKLPDNANWFMMIQWATPDAYLGRQIIPAFKQELISGIVQLLSSEAEMSLINAKVPKAQRDPQKIRDNVRTQTEANIDDFISRWNAKFGPKVKK
jgi:hypothetical protein